MAYFPWGLFHLKKISRILFFVVVSILFWVQSVLTDQSQVETKIEGKVLSIEIVPIDSDHPEGGVHLSVQANQSKWIVHVGPQWLRDNRSIGVGTGSEVMVIGTTLRFGKSNEISPLQIRKKP